MTLVTKKIGQLGYDDQMRDSLNDAAVELPLAASGFLFKGEHDPSVSEYPATPTAGDLWIINTATPYTFTAGDLIGQQVATGNQIAYGGTAWAIVNYSEFTQAELDLKRDIADSYSKTEIDAKPTGRKNLLINGRGLVQQRGVTGGRVQVVLNTRNAGGSHTISFTGTATATIKEATTLAASDALTTWDTALATGVASGTTVTLTAGKYVHVEFSTTNWDFAQLELGSVPTNFEYIHNEEGLCYPYYERLDFNAFSYISAGSYVSALTRCPLHYIEKVTTPLITHNSLRIIKSGGATVITTVLTSNINKHSAVFEADALGDGILAGNGGSPYIAMNAEIFNADDGIGINYKEDRWYV